MDSSSSNIVERLLTAPQYTLPQAEKAALLAEELRALTEFHREHCAAYRQIVDGLPALKGDGLEKIPFIPVRLFKTLKLQSVGDTEILKTLTSSGTTSQQVSKIVIDKGTSLLQTKALAAIITSFIGPKRLPMIIIDSSAVLKDRNSMSARGAGLVGLSNFGRDHFYALDAEMRLNVSGLKDFIAKHADEPILIFGFTYMVWQYFHRALTAAGEKLDLRNAILIHSGGWKKLQEQAVSNESFKSALREQTGIARIHNFYGMVEQVGGVYMECEAGCFHAPNMAEIIIRDARDWSALPAGESGLIQTLSVLPRSYPGQSLLTEDVGQVLGWDDCACGRKGARFKVEGRMERAELRGCSDTHAFSQAEVGRGIRQFLPERKAAEKIEELVAAEFFAHQPLPAFDPLTIDFLDRASAEILKTPDIKEEPDLTALAFWLRKANITSIIKSFQSTLRAGEIIQPLGVALHIAPSNVDTIFLYSWALALLAGNLNVVRVSQKPAPALDILLAALSRVLNEPRFKSIRARNVVLTYPHDAGANEYLSQTADARLVWGGDKTVSHLRATPAKPTTREISFADKVSHAIIQSEKYLAGSAEERASCAKAFYNDAYQFDQMACSSPHFVVFAGPQPATDKASALFWSALQEELRRRGHGESDSGAMDKLAGAAEILGSDARARLMNQNPAVVSAPLESFSALRERRGGGFFIEARVNDLADLAPALRQGDQTLSYFGFTAEETQQAARVLTLRGIDRIVPIGQALNFGPVWDGYVLLAELTRRVTLL
jgi:hypothetical protein